MGGLTTSEEFLQTFGNPNASLLGFMVSAYDVGALFGALFQFVMGDRFGRKTNCIAGAVTVASKHLEHVEYKTYADKLQSAQFCRPPAMAYPNSWLAAL